MKKDPLSVETRIQRRDRLIERVIQAAPDIEFPKAKLSHYSKLVLKDIEKVPEHEILRHWINDLNLRILACLDIDYWGSIMDKLKANSAK